MSMITDFIGAFQYEGLTYPYLPLIIIPVAILMFFLIRHDFVQLREEEETRKLRKIAQIVIFFSRLLIFTLLLFALAGPFKTQEKIFDGDPVVHVLIDQSRSMEVYNDVSEQITTGLKKKIDVEVSHLDRKNSSDIGSAILSRLRPYESIVILSDGNANAGADLGDVGLYAAKINASVHAISLDVNNTDRGVSIIGPSKVLEGINNDFFIRVNTIGTEKAIPLLVKVDGKVEFDEVTDKPAIKIEKQFDEGFHTIEAIIKSTDHFSENNKFYKTVKSVSKPKVLYVTEKKSPLETLFSQQYKVDSVSNLAQANLDDYYSIIMNNIKAPVADKWVDTLTPYIADGNGLLVVGGDGSYNYGDYRFSEFETLLPVQVAKPQKKEGDVSIVVVIDISGSTRATVAGGDKAVDIEKALALSILSDLKATNKLGVVAFNTDAFVVSPIEYIYEKVGLLEKVGRLTDGGGTHISAGMLRAIDMLVPEGGSKNIVLISDGKTQLQDAAIESAKLASNQGIRIYTVGVGAETDDNTLQTLANIGAGIYFRASQASRLRILFGDVDEEREKDIQDVVILNSNHFITNNMQRVRAELAGYNQVVPKTTANMLVTTGAADPLLSIWRFGLGRTAALATDDGTKWAGPLLNAQNSKLLVRTLNWIIGDPDRKETNTVNIDDTRLGTPTELLIKADQPPVSNQYTFYKIDDTSYSAIIDPKGLGFSEVLGATFATNYISELQFLGPNPELGRLIGLTGGSVFEASQTDLIINQTKARAKRTINSKDAVRYPWVVLAILLFILEIVARRFLRQS
jgi:uncharacterized membrane protein